MLFDDLTNENVLLYAAKAYDKYIIENNLEHTTNFKKEIQK